MKSRYKQYAESIFEASVGATAFLKKKYNFDQSIPSTLIAVKIASFYFILLKINVLIDTGKLSRCEEVSDKVIKHLVPLYTNGSAKGVEELLPLIKSDISTAVNKFWRLPMERDPSKLKDGTLLFEFSKDILSSIGVEASIENITMLSNIVMNLDETDVQTASFSRYIKDNETKPARRRSAQAKLPPEKKKIRGWLLFFLIIIYSMLLFVFTGLLVGINNYGIQAANTYTLIIFSVIFLTLITLTLSISNRSRKAVWIIKIILLLIFLGGLYSLLVSPNLSSGMTTLCFAISWYIYFDQSKRIKETFGEK